MAGVKYIGPLFDGSGYSEAARNYVLSIHKQGYPITVSPITFEQTRPDLGADGQVLHSLVNKKIDYDKVIVHSTPNLWHHFTRYDVNKYIIGYTVWETSKLHPVWVNACSRANEVWVPCDWNIEVFRDSGVNRPLFKVPHAIEVVDQNSLPNLSWEGISDNDFVFYSIFQWQERKNPYALLAAYNVAFSGVDDVVLVLKTYRRDHASTEEKEHIRQSIIKYRNDFALPHFPKIVLVVANMSRQEILGLHKRGDAFVLLQRAEGWGLPHFEAAMCGKPVITTDYGGQTEFLKPEHSYLVDSHLTPVVGMTSFSDTYLSTQYWAEPNVKTAIDSMRHVYENRGEARVRGEKARQYISDNFTWDVVGDIIVKRLQQLDQGVIKCQQ